MRLHDADFGGGGAQRSIRLADSAGRHMGDLTFHLDILRDLGHLWDDGRVCTPGPAPLSLLAGEAPALGQASACMAPASLVVRFE